MLDIFCIIPRKEAYEAPSVFSDIPFSIMNNVWYYAAVKEAYFQGFVTGYLGEVNRATGLPPFKAEQTITRAEAVKVILEGLVREGAIKIENIPVAVPWYVPYMRIALDLSPYLQKNQLLKNVFIVTPDEAQTPDKALTRAELIAMADRVLTAYDCGTIDTDGDGMPDYWEKQNGLNPLDSSDADKDPDGDGLTNLQEYKYGTDPHNPDTDGGGVKDGVEVGRGTDPLDPNDDTIVPDPRANLDPGIYVIPQECLQCPCPLAIDHTADIIPSDTIFAVISNNDDSQIFSRSNAVEIQQTPGTQ